MMLIPEYKTIAGIILPEADFGEGGKFLCVQSTNEEECRAYAAFLEQEGFTCHSAEEISGGSERPHNVNLFYAFVKEDVHIFMSWSAALRTLRIRASAPSSLPRAERVKNFTAKATPSVTQLQMEKSGICHAVQLADGSFVLNDGGLAIASDIERLYAFLKEKSLEEKPRIALWMFSHPDCDHVHLATEFLTIYKDAIEVEAFAYQFPDMDTVSLLYQNNEAVRKDKENLENAIRTCFPKAAVYTLHTGQHFYYPGVTIEILWTADMLYPYHYVTANDFSGAWRFRFDSGKTYLFMGDCMLDACSRIALVYGDYLKSDIFQVTHHGLIGGELGLYKLVDPEVCLWSTSEARFAGSFEEKFRWCIGGGGCDYNAWIRDDAVRKREHYHQGTTTTLLI